MATFITNCANFAGPLARVWLWRSQSAHWFDYGFPTRCSLSSLPICPPPKTIQRFTIYALWLMVQREDKLPLCHVETRTQRPGKCQPSTRPLVDLESAQNMQRRRATGARRKRFGAMRRCHVISVRHGVEWIVAMVQLEPPKIPLGPGTTSHFLIPGVSLEEPLIRQT
jgi:hypothetical protein